MPAFMRPGGRITALLSSGAAAALMTIGLAACGGSDDGTTSTNGNRGSKEDTPQESKPQEESSRPLETTCKPAKAEPQPEADFAKGDAKAGVTVTQPTKDLTVKVVPDKALTMASIEADSSEPPVGAVAKDGTLLFVTFQMTNSGDASVAPAQIGELFFVRTGGTIYQVPAMCRAQQAYALEESLAGPGQAVEKGDTVDAVVAYAVPEDGQYEWLDRTTRTSLPLNVK
jgi:hypothetical protein